MANFPNDDVLTRDNKFPYNQWDKEDVESYQMSCEGYLHTQKLTLMENSNVSLNVAGIIYFGAGIEETFSTPEDAAKALKLMKTVFEFAGRHVL